MADSGATSTAENEQEGHRRRDARDAMKTVIILGLTYNQIPLAQKARSMGYRAVGVGVGGGEDACRRHLDACYPIDTSDLDAVLDLSRREGAGGLLTCGTSTAICTIAYVNERLGLSEYVMPYRVAVNAAHKDRFRTVIQDLLPRGLSASDPGAALAASSSLTPPLIVKPGDGGGGKGITVIREAGGPGLDRAFEYASDHSRDGVIVVEEFLEGAVLGVESLVLDGVVHVLAIADKIVTPPPRCITLGVIFPSRLPAPLQERILAVNAEAVRRLGIRWGPTHIDMAVDGRDEPRIIDIGPRLAGGALMATMVPRARHFDVYGATVQLATGTRPEAPGPGDGRHYGSRFVLAPGSGILGSVSYPERGIDELNIENVRQLISNGRRIPEVDHDGARVLMFTSSAATYEGVDRNLTGFAASVAIDVDSR